ncbi:MAG: hypothetical protein ACRDZ7_19605 [Acidimicrobiia bacterium]
MVARPSTTRASTGTTARPAATTSTTRAATSGQLTYQTLLGKALTDPAIVAYLNNNRCESNGSSSYLCRSAGTFVTFGGSDRRVVRVRMYAGADGVTAYTGALPRGLTWSDTRAAVERKIGSPQTLRPGVATSPPVFAVAIYSGPTMEITYQWTDGPPPPDAKMFRLEIAST